MSNEERILTSPDGTKIWAESAGDPSKPAVVFIHGLACTALGFDKQFSDPELQASLHMVRYEMRGHGRSGMPENPEAYESIRYAEDFRIVCEAFALSKPFVLGWSMGGCVPVDVVQAYGPEFISGVLYVGGGVLSRSFHPLCMHPIIKAIVPSIRSLDATASSKGAADFVDSCVAEPLPFEVKLQWMGGYTMQTPQARVLSLGRVQDQTRWQREAGGLPVLIVQGTEDLHCVSEVMIALAKEVYKKVDVKMMPGVGHCPHFERPEETNRYILDFINGHAK